MCCKKNTLDRDLVCDGVYKTSLVNIEPTYAYSRRKGLIDTRMPFPKKKRYL